MDKDLKKLNRMELLQLLLQASESNEALAAENEELRRMAASAQAQAASAAAVAAREPAPAQPAQQHLMQSAKVGSIAEAALQANGFFEAAQNAADEYLREIKKLRDQMVERSSAQAGQETGKIAPAGGPQGDPQQLIEQIQQQAKTYIKDVQTYANNVIARANEQASGIVASAQSQSDEILARANEQARQIVERASAYVPEAPVPTVPSESRANQSSQAPAGATGPLMPSGMPLAANAYEAALQAAPSQVMDPSATGQLFRRGRHVKLPDGVEYK